MPLPECPCPHSTTSRYCFGTVVTCKVLESLEDPIPCHRINWLGDNGHYTDCPVYRESLKLPTRSPITPEFIADFSHFFLVNADKNEAGTCDIRPRLAQYHFSNICPQINGSIYVVIEIEGEEFYVRNPGSVYPHIRNCGECVLFQQNLSVRLQKIETTD